MCIDKLSAYKIEELVKKKNPSQFSKDKCDITRNPFPSQQQSQTPTYLFWSSLDKDTNISIFVH